MNLFNTRGVYHRGVSTLSVISGSSFITRVLWTSTIISGHTVITGVFYRRVLCGPNPLIKLYRQMRSHKLQWRLYTCYFVVKQNARTSSSKCLTPKLNRREWERYNYKYFAILLKQSLRICTSWRRTCI